MSLVNVSYNFQMLKSEIRYYFLSKKCEKLLLFAVQKLLIFMPPTSEKLRGHIGLGLSVRPSVRPSVCP